MSTSLARQLAALRTPATQALTQDTAYSGPFLIEEANQDNCNHATLTQNAKYSFEDLRRKEGYLAQFEEFLFQDNLGEKLESELIEELLFILSPYTLLKSAQWLLQLLVTKNKIHYKYPEQFLFCILPYYEYDIYAKALLAIDTTPGGTDYPNWFPKFKVMCAPTTKLNLYRHTASDNGFLKLLTDMMLKLVKTMYTFPNIRLQRQVSMFVMTILGALQNKENITEEQAHYILQVIFKAMKYTTHPELMAMAQILLSYTLPIVNFKAKVINKILKRLEQNIEKKASLEALMLLMLMVRTQFISKREKVWCIVISLEGTINQVVNLADEPDMAKNADDILYTLSEILSSIVPKDKKKTKPLSAIPRDACQILGFASQIMMKVRVSDDSCAAIGDLASKILKSISNTDDEFIVDLDSLTAAKNDCDVIVKQMNAVYPHVYQQVMVDTDDIDLFFLGNQHEGGLTNKPDEDLVIAKKIILNNNLIGLFKDHLINPKLAFNEKAVRAFRKIDKDVNALLSVDTQFLMDQLPGQNFQNLLFSILIFQTNQELALKHLCSNVACTQQNDTMEVDGDNEVEEDRVDCFRLEMTLLACFLKHGKSEVIFNSYFGKKSSLISCLSSISPDHPDKLKAVEEKLCLCLDISMLNSFMKDSFLWNNTMLAKMFLQAVKHKISSKQLKVDVEKFCNFLCDVMHSNISAVPHTSADLNTVCLQLLGLVDLDVDVGVHVLLRLPALVEAGDQTVVSANILEILESKLRDEMEVLSFYLNCASKTQSCPKATYIILSRLKVILENENFVKILMSPDHHVFPLMVNLVLDPDQNIRKLGFSVVKSLEKMKVKGAASDFAEIIKFLAENRSELVSDVSSLASLLDKTKLESQVLHKLVMSTTKCHPVIFEHLISFFTLMKSADSINVVADFGVSLVVSEKSDEILALIIRNFYKKIIKNIDQASCYKMFLSCISCSRVVTVAGLKLRISDLLLDKCASPKLWSTHNQNIVKTILLDVIELVHMQSANVKLIPMLSAMNIPVNMFVDMVVLVWGEKELYNKSRGGQGNFSGEASVGLGEAELKIWGKTVFLLELLDSYLPTECSDAGWQALTPPIFSVFRKLTNEDVLESSYKLNLILTVLLKLLTIIPDARIKELKQSDLEPELLTYCIRRSSNPESRQLALKVLAKCALTIPEYVLQNSMTIFTFMGTHLLKMDSKHSYQIACEAIDVIIPAMKSTSSNKTELKKISLEILNNFIHMEEDVPEHRYSEFVFRLIKALDSDSYLWIAMLLCVKSTFKSKQRVARTHLIHTRQLELIQRFSLTESLKAIIGIFINLRSDGQQLRKMFGCGQDRRQDSDKADEWDVLRLGGLVLLTKLISDSNLITRVGSHLALQQDDKVKDLLHLLLESSLLTMESFTSLPANIPEKLKSSILEQSEICLQLVLSLLPYRLYINIAGELLAASNPILRYRALEVVASKLEACDDSLDISEDVKNLLPSLLKLAVEESLPANQQMAFLALRQLSRKTKDPKILTQALKKLDVKFLHSIKNPGVLGASILTITDILMTAEVQGVEYLSSLVEWMLSALDSIETHKWEEKYEKVVYHSLLLGIQKIMEKFGGFINPYLEKIVIVACRLHSHTLAGSRGKELWESVVENVSAHVLLPKSRSLLKTVWQEPDTVAKLAGLIGLNCKKLDRGQLTSMDKMITDFFNKALTYRHHHPNNEQVESTEAEIIEAFLSVGLKMCLDDFIPLYNKMADKLSMGDDDKLIALFNFSERIAASLKNLFAFGQDFVLKQSGTVLAKKDTTPRCATAVLRCVSKVMMYNKITTLNQESYESLVASILPLFQMSVDLHQDIEDALIAIADGTDNEVYWKHLNYSVLLELRNSDPVIRIRVLQIIRRFVTSRKDTYMVVLPDAVPFMTEVLEDDEQKVEVECKSLIQHMETVFMQNIESYFA